MFYLNTGLVYFLNDEKFFEVLFQFWENVTKAKILPDNRLFVYEIHMFLHAMPNIRYQLIVDLKRKEYSHIP